MLKKRSVIAIPTFISLGLMGSFHAFWGTTLPLLRSFLNLNIQQATVLTAYNLAAQAIACVLGGLLCDLIRRDKILFAGCLLLGSGAFILILLFLQLAGLLIAWQTTGWISAAALAISGLGCSGIFPSLLALTGTLFFNVAGTSLGVLAAMNWIGGMVIVWTAGFLSQRVGVQFGFVAIVLASLAGVVVHLLKYKTFLRAETVAVITTKYVDN